MVGLPLRSAVLTGLTLAQVGEFSFVLAHAGLEAGLFSPQYFQLFLGSSILSMIAAPFLIGLGPAFAEWSMRLPVPQALKVGRLADTPRQRLYDHLIIIGFGLSGRNIAHVADSCRIPYVVIDTNPETVRSERALGRMIYHGDATCSPVLEHADVEAARVAVVAISDMIGTGRVVEMIRALNPAIHIIVRARYLAHAEQLLACGANEVVPEEYETSVEIFTRVLHKYLVPKEEIDALINQIRASGYRMLRTESTTGASVADLDVILSGMEVRCIRVGNGSSAVGRSLSQINLRKDYGITILAIRRGGETIVLPDGDDCFQAGDDVVLLGLPELLVFADTIFHPPSRETKADE
jgi:CPA2 family monovalent cation:H+ antiporter-2